MSPLAIVSSTMLVVSLILAGAMAIAWASFGRPRHAMSWAIAYLCYAGEVVMSALGHALPPLGPLFFSTGLLLILASAAMVVIGARQRARLPGRLGLFALAVIATFGAAMLTTLLPSLLPYTAAAGSLFTAAALPFAIAAVRPRGRTADPAEWAMIGALSIFVAYEALLAATAILQASRPDGTLPRLIFFGLYMLGLMPIFIANGITAILLLASDLAAQLRTLAANDPLTGSLNRRGFHDAAMRAIANGRRQRQAIAIAIADIDLFKSINDRYGHTAGDRTLAFIAACLARGLRQEDLVGRIGGEEFALLLVNSSAEQAAEAMERIRIEIATGFSEDGAPVPVTASFGVAAVPAAGAATEQILADALDAADRALYRSKVEGRNRTTLAA